MTDQLGRSLGETAPPGGVLLLSGPVGVGKSVVASGVLSGLGVALPHPSPTYTLVRLYQGRLPVAHLDLYRLGPGVSGDEFGWEDLLDGNRVVIVEWGEYLAPTGGEVRMCLGRGQRMERAFRVEAEDGAGLRWLRAACVQWYKALGLPMGAEESDWGEKR